MADPEFPDKAQRAKWRELAKGTQFVSAVGEYTPAEFTILLDAIDVVESCRDHWKTSFEHERANVIRLRQEIASQHAIHYEARSGQCECGDCKLVRAHSEPKSRAQCETTMTERFDIGGCDCKTYPDNLGPCKTYERGSNGNCVYCDHEKSCHERLAKIVKSYSEMQANRDQHGK